MYNQGGSSSGLPEQITAWDVFKAHRSPHPPNPLRYQHNLWLVLLVFLAAIGLTASIIAARGTEADMRADTVAFKAEGFPDLPPGYATDRQLQNFIDEWRQAPGILPNFDRIVEASDRVGQYQDDTSIINLGVMGSLLALVFLSAYAFSRALNNLYALGYGASVLSPAWAFISWMLPILSFVLPWRVVSEVFQCSWTKPDEATGFRWTHVVSALWGIAFAGLWILNPVTVNWFVPRNDIDQWISHIEWTETMLLWLPVPAFFTAAMLLVVALRQHSRYRQLDAQAAGQSD